VQRQARLAMVGQLAAGIAHDFNNVMAVIVLYSQLLSVSPNLTVKEKKQIQTIFNESKRAAELTSQILDFGRKSVLDRQLIDMRPFLEEFVRLLRRTLPEYIEVELTHEEEEDYLVTADATRLQQALMNLALNARDAMPKGGRIRIGLGHLDFLPQEQKPVPDLAAGEWVKIVVSDNGSGISAEEQDHLFEPFYTTKEPGKGTGLGLAQVYGIVKQHNGFIGVESDLGWGTTFTIIIPMEREGRPGGPIAVPHTLATGNGELILIVEDNSATRIALMAALESLNYKVKGADNGIEALILLRRHRDEIALVISDVVMPEMGGIALLDAMEKGDITIPAILLTGNSATEEMELVKAKGRVTWYMKPISLEKLGKVVAEKISGQ
jgi:CheY-like chemotaxis protein